MERDYYVPGIYKLIFHGCIATHASWNTFHLRDMGRACNYVGIMYQRSPAPPLLLPVGMVKEATNRLCIERCKIIEL
mgnify:FL=1